MSDSEWMAKQFNEMFNEFSSECKDEKEYLQKYAFLIFKITTNFISLGRSLCRSQSNKKLGKKIENWLFNDTIGDHINDLSVAMYGTEYLETSSKYLRFALSRLATISFFLAIVLGDKEDPDTVDPNIIERDLIKRMNEHKKKFNN